MSLSKKEILVVLLLLCIAVVRFLFFIPKSLDYESAVGKTVKIQGKITEPPDVRLNSKHLTLTPEKEEAGILIVTPLDAEILYGDIVKVKGVLERPENFITDAGKEFDYVRYLSNHNIYFLLKNPKIEIVSRDKGNFLKKYLYQFKDAFMKNISYVLPPGESDLANGLVLGARGGFDKETQAEFITTGTIHIVALSGYNVTIVANTIMRATGLVLSRTISLVLGFIVVVLFIVMAGVTPTSVRAGIMASITLLAKITGRKYDAGRALVIALLLMIAHDARVVTDISFQLSFLATFGVLYITPKVFPWFTFVPIRFALRETIATTVAATIAVLPALLYSTGVLSLVSLPANILILPLISATMFCVFITGVLGFVSQGIALLFSYVPHVLLWYILSTIHFFAELPFASVTIRSFPIVVVLFLYGCIGWWVFRKQLDTSCDKSSISARKKD